MEKKYISEITYNKNNSKRIYCPLLNNKPNNTFGEKYKKQGLQIIGIHAPKFVHKKNRSNIEKKVKEFKLHQPIMVDNDFSYWRSLNNPYWPSYYLVNQQGEIVYNHVGETHEGDRKAINLERKIQ